MTFAPSSIKIGCSPKQVFVSDKFSKFLLTDFSHNGQTVMLAPAGGFYTSPNLGKDEVRIAFVLNSEKLLKAIKIIGLALKEYKD